MVVFAFPSRLSYFWASPYRGGTARLSGYVAARQPKWRTVGRAAEYQILWVRGFRDHTISGRGFNLFKPLRRHFRATQRLSCSLTAVEFHELQ